MKTKILYAPVLLLSLSIACGKAEHKANTTVAEREAVQQILAAAPRIDVPTPAAPVPMGGTMTPAAVMVAPLAVPTAVASPAPGAPVAVPAATPVAPVPAITPDPAEVVTPPAVEDTAAGADFKTGITAVDDICALSFKALQAKDQVELDAVKLTAPTNTACLKILLSVGSSLITELKTLGTDIVVQLSGKNILLTGSVLTSVVQSSPAAGQYLLIPYIDATRDNSETYSLPDANEKLAYIQQSIEELKALDPANRTPADDANLAMLQLSLEVQTDSVNTLKSRIDRLQALLAFTNLAVNVSYIGQSLAPPTTNAPVVPPAPPAPTNTPVPAGTPSGDVPSSPVDVPTGPAPTPAPEPGPTPGPVPAGV